MPLNRRLVDADYDVGVLHAALAAPMLPLPEAVRDTLPADLLRNIKWTLSLCRS